MTPRDLVLLRLFEGELGKTVLPALSETTALRMATLGNVQLGRLIVEETTVPALKTEAVAAWHDMLPGLRGVLDVDLHQRFELALDGAASDWDDLEYAFGAVAESLLRNAEAAPLARRLMAIEARLRDGREAAWTTWKNREAETAAPESAELSEEQVTHLVAFIKRRFPAETRLRIVGAKPLLGGFSKHTLFLDLADNVELPDRLVLRRDSPYFTAGWSIRFEFPVIETMYAAGVAVAKPYAVDSEGDVIGTPFMLLSHVPGRNIGDFLTAQPNRAVALDLARKIAALHAAPTAGLENLLQGGGMTTREFITEDITRYETMWQGVKHQRAGTMQAAIAWLKRRIDLADGPRSIVHRDIGFHNLLAQDDRVSAFLDWEAVIIGASVEDLAYLYYVIPQMVEWESFLAAYEEAAGRRVDRNHLDYYVIFSMVRTAAAVYRLADPVFGGERDNLQVYYLGSCFGDVILQRISSKLAEVLAK